jgi:hypothetical protein
MSLEHAAAIQPGDHVLVLGATGVTGSMAVLHPRVQAKPLADVEQVWTAAQPSGTRVVLVP